MEIGKKLKEKREAANLTQKELAEILHVSRQTISSWEVGRTYPDLDVLVAISELYETPLDDLLKEDSQMVKDITDKVKKSERRRTLNIILSAVLVAILGMGLSNVWENAKNNRENEYGLSPSDLIESSWNMFYSPETKLASSMLSFDSDSVMIRNQHAMLMDPFLAPEDLDRDSVFGFNNEHYENIIVEPVEDTYVVTGQGYKETFVKLSEDIIRDSKGTEYQRISDTSSHEAFRYFDEMEENRDEMN